MSLHEDTPEQPMLGLQQAFALLVCRLKAAVIRLFCRFKSGVRAEPRRLLAGPVRRLLCSQEGQPGGSQVQPVLANKRLRCLA